VEQPGNLERALAPAAPYLAGLAVAYATLSGLVCLAGELAGWLWTRRWPPSQHGRTGDTRRTVGCVERRRAQFHVELHTGGRSDV
jgi:hypothetical protein